MASIILCIAGPTASGKSARAVEEALAKDGEVISVDSRQVYRGLDIGTEKISREEMRGIPHHLIDIRDARDEYSASEFVTDARARIEEITARGKLPILAGGTHFYFDALLHGLPESAPPDPSLREKLEALSSAELYARIKEADARRALELDPQNKRRLIRALEIIAAYGSVPFRPRRQKSAVAYFRGHQDKPYDVKWIVIDPPIEELRTRICARLEEALAKGLIEEVRRVREEVGDARLNELGLEYRVIGEWLRAGGTEPCEVLLPALLAKLGQYARRQKAWLRKLELTEGAVSHSDRS